MSKPSKAEVLAWLEGQRRAQEFTERERRQRLGRATCQQRLETFNALCDLFRPFSLEKQLSLDKLKLRELARVRRLVRRVSEAQAHE